MPADQMTTDVRALLDREPFDASAVLDLREVLGRDPSRYRTLRDAAQAMNEISLIGVYQRGGGIRRRRCSATTG